MCGIVGFASSGNESEDKEHLERLKKNIYHRGPDGEGAYFDEYIYFGMRRLAIQDVDHGHQPTFNENKTIAAVFNGEIYNHNALREELSKKGHVLNSNADTEVITHLYEEFGPEFVTKLRGMFSIFLWDVEKRTGYLYRDHYGIKPVYYTNNKLGFSFSSELKGLRNLDVRDAKIDPQALDLFLTYSYIPSPYTIYKDVHKVKPGHYLEFLPSKELIEHQFWKISSTFFMKPSNENIADAIQESVNAHMISDVPVSSFLSGGIDSSIVTKYASQNKSYANAITMKIQSSKVLFDETPQAVEVVQENNIQNHSIVDLEAMDASFLIDAAKIMEEPFGDDSLLPTYQVSEQASKVGKVCLSGLGGDELFGGYVRYRGMYLLSFLSRTPKWILVLSERVTASLLGLIGSRKLSHLQKLFKAAQMPSDQAWISIISSQNSTARRLLYKPGRITQDHLDATAGLVTGYYNEAHQLNSVDKAIIADLSTYVADDILTLSDKMSMYHSLEVRVPFMDKELFSKYSSNPVKLKVNFKMTKVELRKALVGILPKSILGGKKQGFESASGELIKGTYSKLFDKYVLSLECEFLEKIYIQRLYDEHGRTKDHGKILFNILMYRIWMCEVYKQ